MQLTERANQLLEALKSSGNWMSRAQLAKATGKNLLSPHDKDLLERLIASGLIEKRQRSSVTPVGIAYDYRAIDNGEKRVV
jgi:predicted transcriptional regulator